MSDDKNVIPKSLKDALKAGNVIPFVGAGASMSVKKKNDDGTESQESLFPSWKGFVETLAEALREEGKPDEADYILSSIKIKKPKYLDALQHAQEQLGKRLWYNLFDKSFNIPRDKAHQDSLAFNKLIWELGRNLIITTNVDRVLQWTCPQPPEFTILDVQNVEYGQLQNEEFPANPTVWHLHGHITHKEKVIFTREQFDDFYKQRNNDAKLQALLSVLTRKTLLFIGFSLDDAYLREQLEYIHKIYQGANDSYYILLHKDEIAKADLPEYVTPIPFADFGEPLENLVAELARIAKSDDKQEDKNPDADLPKPEKKPFFNVEFRSKGAEFVGRVGKIEEIWNQLNKSGCASIGQGVNVKGLGGYGKTQLAVEYAHAKRDEYKNGVYWVVADQPIETQLLTIGDARGWTANANEQTNQLEAAKNGFRALSDCLILFDNVESYDDIKDYLPKHDAKTHILITSRERISKFHQFDLEFLDRDESRELLLKIANRTPQSDAEKAHLEEILEILGDIPLALELVGGYLAEHELMTFAKYHQFLDEVPLDKLEKEFPQDNFTNHDRSIIQTLRISEKTINEKPLMVEILKVLAWSGSSSMGVSLLQTLVEAEDDFEFENALSDAHKLRLLRKDEDSERYTIHRLLAKVIRHENPLENQPHWHGRVIDNLEAWFNPRANRFEKLTEFESEIEHLETWQEKTLENLPAKSVSLLQLRGSIPNQRGLYHKALDFFKEASNLYKEEKLTDKNLLASLQNDSGLSYSALGNYEEALKYQLQSLEIHRELFGERHLNTAISLNNVGSTYSELGKHKKALKYQLQSLKILRELFGEKHPNTAMSLNNVGYTYGELDNDEEALKYQSQSLEIRRELFGEKHPNTATSLINVGYIYGKLGNYEEALKYQLQSLKVLHELFGEKHPSTASSLNNIGSTYGALGNHEKALKYQLQSLKIHRELLGSNHPNTIIIAGNTIFTYIKLGENGKAKRLATEFLNYLSQDYPDRKFFEGISVMDENTK